MADRPQRAPEPSERRLPALDWLDPLKGLALAWIWTNHLAERVLGYPLFANPTGDWPPLAERIEQLRPLPGDGWLPRLADLLRYVGWSGDQGVQVFLLLSGFGLAYGCAHEPGPLDRRRFFARRLLRLYPTWWAAHAVLWFLALVLAWPLGGVRNFGLSLLGLRVLPGSLYTPVPAWWFVGLLLQLYLLFPWLRALLLRLGPGRFLAAVLVVTLPLRAAGLLLCTDYLDAWSRGAVALSRLPEFAAGMALAAWWAHRPDAAAAWLGRAGTRGAALLAWAVGVALSFTLLGMTAALLLTGVGAFVLLFGLQQWLAGPLPRLRALLAWIGAHSYSLYLVHHPVLLNLLPDHGMRGIGIGLLLALPTTLLAALGLERLVAAAEGLLARRREPGGRRRLLVLGGGVPLLLLGLLVAADQWIRAADPREVAALGWGERPALQPDAEFGWKLIPGQVTRLRWDDYDYTVTANSLGFPGPEPAAATPDDGVRILTVGDAFTSAEGVDTAQSWPRRLEQQLRAQRPGRPIEVCNFAITGYGPEQYAAVLTHFVPQLRPQLVLVGFFVNDFEDATIDVDAFRRGIGFAKPSPTAWKSRLLPLHLQRWLAAEVIEPLRELVTGEPRAYGYVLGWYSAFERSAAAGHEAASARVAERLRAMQAVCAANGARLQLVLVPASAQVCGPGELAYQPRGMSLQDAARFDADRPQRTAQALAAALAVPCLDLRPALLAAGGGCYQRRNMHWTSKGHAVAAAAVAAALLASPLLAAR